MKIKLAVILIISLLFMGVWFNPAFALEHSQKDGLFSMDIPQEWHWVEYPEEIGITYPDGKMVAIDIQFVQSSITSPIEMKKTIKESNEKMIKEGVEAHNGTLIDDKEIKLDGVYATQLDFKTSPPNSIGVTYISTFVKDYAVTITYGTDDEKMHLLLDDAVATIKFK